jgi:hypothetical protein
MKIHGLNFDLSSSAFTRGYAFLFPRLTPLCLLHYSVKIVGEIWGLLAKLWCVHRALVETVMRSLIEARWKLTKPLLR